MKLRSLAAAVMVVILLNSAAAQEDFGYKSGTETGPENWGELRPEWATCGDGELQSPIDLRDEAAPVDSSLGQLLHSYVPADAAVKNRGHDIMVAWNGGGSLWIDGTGFGLKQLHWHTPSEHTKNGRRFPLEMHIVHQSADNMFAVVAILYDIGSPDPFIAQIEGSLKKLKDMKDGEDRLGSVNPSEAIQVSRDSYYRYIGSLTTPPCTEGVTWTVLTQEKTVSNEQVNLLKEAVEDIYVENARPLQAINGRNVRSHRLVPVTLHYN